MKRGGTHLRMSAAFGLEGEGGKNQSAPKCFTEKFRLNQFGRTETLGGFLTKPLGYFVGSVYTARAVKEKKQLGPECCFYFSLC